MLEGKWVLHHDDPPCEAKLTSGGFCTACNLTPDMQSTCLYLYCPLDNLRLKNRKCPKCGKIFKRPG